MPQEVVQESEEIVVGAQRIGKGTDKTGPVTLELQGKEQDLHGPVKIDRQTVGLELQGDGRPRPHEKITEIARRLSGPFDAEGSKGNREIGDNRKAC